MYEEKYKLNESELIALINGKKLIFHLPGNYHIEIVPPLNGITISYHDWEFIKSYLLQTTSPFYDMESFIKKIENRK